MGEEGACRRAHKRARGPTSSEETGAAQRREQVAFLCQNSAATALGSFLAMKQTRKGSIGPLLTMWHVELPPVPSSGPQRVPTGERRGEERRGGWGAATECRCSSATDLTRRRQAMMRHGTRWPQCDGATMLVRSMQQRQQARRLTEMYSRYLRATQISYASALLAVGQAARRGSVTWHPRSSRAGATVVAKNSWDAGPWRGSVGCWGF